MPGCGSLHLSPLQEDVSRMNRQSTDTRVQQNIIRSLPLILLLSLRAVDSVLQWQRRRGQHSVSLSVASGGDGHKGKAQSLLVSSSPTSIIVQLVLFIPSLQREATKVFRFFLDEPTLQRSSLRSNSVSFPISATLYILVCRDTRESITFTNLTVGARVCGWFGSLAFRVGRILSSGCVGKEQKTSSPCSPLNCCRLRRG